MNARVLEIIADKRVCLRQAYRIAKREGAIKHEKPSKDKINKDYKINKGEWV